MKEISKTGRVVVVIAVLIILGLLSAVAVSYMQGTGSSDRDDLETWTQGDKLYPVTINRPDLMPMVDSGKKDHKGKTKDL